MNRVPFRIGTTSYIIEAGLVENARYLATRVDDMQLVLFHLEDGPSNFPTAAEVSTLAQIGRGDGLAYSVHLPLDIELAEDGSANHRSLDQARRVIEATWPLQPTAYVLHLQAASLLRPDLQPEDVSIWCRRALRALVHLNEWAGSSDRLVVENVEGFPLDYLEPVLLHPEVRRCIDIGHLWLDNHDPVPYLNRHLPRTDVIHLHGVARRDHQSLHHQGADQIDAVFETLLVNRYTGLITLEIFGQPDFDNSMGAVQASLTRLREKGVWAN